MGDAGEQHPAPATGRSLKPLSPGTPFTLSLAQVVSYALAIGGIGFAIGAVYPRLLSVELAVEQLQRAQGQLQRSQERTASTLARVTTIIERIDDRRVTPPWRATDEQED